MSQHESALSTPRSQELILAFVCKLPNAPAYAADLVLRAGAPSDPRFLPHVVTETRGGNDLLPPKFCGGLLPSLKPPPISVNLALLHRVALW